MIEPGNSLPCTAYLWAYQSANSGKCGTSESASVSIGAEVPFDVRTSKQVLAHIGKGRANMQLN